MIQTVTGSISLIQIKQTLAHEHIVFGKPGVITDVDNCYQREEAYQNAMMRLDMVKKYDVNLIVDPTPMEWGRDVLLMKKLAQKSNVYIVCATGFFKDEGDMLAYLKALSYHQNIVETCIKIFRKELEQGIGNTNIKAGIIKVASSYACIRPLEECIFQAAAKVSNICHVPIFTHCDRGTMASQQVEIFKQENVSPSRVVIGHMTSNENLDEIRQIMRKGFTVGFDQFGIVSIPGIPSDEEKMQNLLTLLKEGFEQHIVLSHDTIFDRMGYVSNSKPRYPDMLFNTVLPYLRSHGISEEAIQKITRSNLLKILEG